MQVDHTRRIAKSLWNSCWRDAKRCFGHRHLGVSHRDLLGILQAQHQIVGRDYGGGSGGVGTACGGTGGVIPRIVPRNPSQKLSVENSALLTKAQHRLLMRAWNTRRDDGTYREVLTKLLQSSTASL